MGWFVIIAASLGTVGIAWGLSWLTTGERDGVLLEWPWYATTATVVAALVLGRFRERAGESV